MQSLIRVSLGLVMLALGCSVAAQQPIIYPAKGQSPQRQQSDTADCQLWAKQTTGVDPVVLAQQASQSGAPPPQGQVLKGAAGGAAPGAADGAIAGDAGKGATVGAIVGTAAGGGKKNPTPQAAPPPNRAEHQKGSPQLATH